MKLRRTALALVVAAAALLVAEWAASRWLPLPALLFRLDPGLLHVPVAGARRVLAHESRLGTRWITTEIGPEGYRGGPLARARRGPRVAVFGDSLVMADSVEEAQTFVERLGVHLREAGAGEVEMVNAGVTGYGPDQACLRVEREIAALAPDLVVLVLCAHNDHGDLVRNKLFDLAPDGAAIPARVALAEDLQAGFAAREQAARKPALARALLRAFEPRPETVDAKRIAWIDLYLAALADEHSEWMIEGDRRARTLFEDFYDADLAIEPHSEAAVFKRRLMRGVLARLADACRRKDVPLFAVVVPSAVDLEPRVEVRVDPRRFPGYRSSRLTDLLAETLAELGIEHVDLYPVLLADDPGASFLGPGDFHWSPRGQDLSARAVAAALRGKNLPESLQPSAGR